MTDEERALVEAIERDPGDDGARLVYADWLEEQGDDRRAAWLRAEVEFHAAVVAERDAPRANLLVYLRRRSEDPSERARVVLAGLRETVPMGWIARFARGPIENRRCTSASVRYLHDCPESWEHLVHAEHPRVRDCQTCGRRVWFCETVAQAGAAAGQGHSVVVEPSQPRDGTLEPAVDAALSQLADGDDLGPLDS